MNKHLSFFFLCLLLLVMTGHTCHAAESPVSVADLKSSFVPGGRVKLEGRFLHKVNFETLLFEDETGRIEVIVDDNNPISSELFDPAFVILISGEVGSGYQQAPVVICDAVEVVSHDPSVVAQEVASADRESGLPNRNHSLKNRCADSRTNRAVEETGSVWTLLNYGCPGQEVTLVGSFVDQINYETLLFRDRTGDIEVVFSDEDLLFLGTTSNTGLVQLTGELVRGYQDTIMISFLSLKEAPTK